MRRSAKNWTKFRSLSKFSRKMIRFLGKLSKRRKFNNLSLNRSNKSSLKTLLRCILCKTSANSQWLITILISKPNGKYSILFIRIRKTKGELVLPTNWLKFTSIPHKCANFLRAYNFIPKLFYQRKERCK